jgi:hypothetical protein
MLVVLMIWARNTGEMNKHIQGMATDYNNEKEGYEAMAAEMEKTKAEFSVFERKDIKFKEGVSVCLSLCMYTYLAVGLLTVASKSRLFN